MKNFFSRLRSESGKSDEIEKMDELPPFKGFEVDEFQQPNGIERGGVRVDSEVPKKIKEEVAQVQDVNGLIQLMTRDSIRNLPSYAQAANLIENINNYYRVNSTSVIVGEMISEKMEEKDSFARGFAELYQSLGDPYDFGIKEKVKELLKAEMKKDFENDSFSYAKKAIRQSATIDQLKRVVGYFNQLKVQDLNTQKDAYFTGQELRAGIENAIEYLDNLIQYQGLAGKDENMIRGEIITALASVPEDDFGIKERCRSLLLEYVLKKKVDEKKGGFWTGLTKRFFGSRRKGQL